MVKNRISLRDIDISVNGTIIGGMEELSVTINRPLAAAGEGGNHKTAEIVDAGPVTIEGTATRAYIDVEILNTLFPNQAVLPEFTLSGAVNNSKSPDRTLKLFGVKFSGVEFSDMAKDSEYIKTGMPFMATDWTFD